jgi:hypothetical protein
MQEWELGRRAMPEYVLHLIAYKVMNELREGIIGGLIGAAAAPWALIAGTIAAFGFGCKLINF